MSTNNSYVIPDIFIVIEEAYTFTISSSTTSILRSCIVDLGHWYIFYCEAGFLEL